MIREAVKIISDKAKYEASIGEKIDCKVALEFSDKRYSYKICKGFTLKKLGSSISDPTDWQDFFNDIEVSKKDIDLFEFHDVFNSDDQTKIINSLIQSNLRQYSLFQGEEVDKLIDFNKAESLNRAVKTLTNINKYDELERITKYVADRAEKEFNERVAANDAASDNYKTKLAEKEQKKNSLDAELEKQISYQDSYNQNKEEVDKLERHNENAEARKKFDDQLKEQIAKYNGLKKEYDHLIEKLNERFFDGNFGWIGMGASNDVKVFTEKLIKYREAHVAKKISVLNERNNNEFNLLPPDSPDFVTLKIMIDREHCHVCNRPAKEDTDEWKYMVSLLHRHEPENSESKKVFKNDLDEFFGDIQSDAQPYVKRINDIKNSIFKTRERVQDLLNKITKVKAKIKNIKDERSHFIVGDDDNMTDARSTMAQYKGAIQRMEKALTDITKIKGRIVNLREGIRQDEAELGRMRPTSTSEGDELHLDISADLRDAAQRTRVRIFDNMISKLDVEANNHFQNLIKYNELAGGILKFEKTPTNGIDFNYVDEDGNAVPGASEGFQRMKVLAVLMAIISVNPQKFQYPLLADAPLSAFGHGFIRGFFEETQKVFPQSIILIKDLYNKDSINKLNPLGEELLTNNSVSTIYLNQIPENLKQIEVYTEHKKIK